MSIEVEITGNGMRIFQDAMRRLGDDGKVYAALRRGLNKTNNMAFTTVKRALAEQAGTTQAATVRYGGLSKLPARGRVLEAKILSRGSAIPLREFRSRQTLRGVSAAPWGRRLIFKHTFLVESIGGHVFKNTGRYNEKSDRNNAIKKLWGPAIPKEMVQGETRKAWERLGRRVLQPEIERQIRLLSGSTPT